ncbi:MAG: hypothetical protein LBU65_15170 [Planctomycetaceae bacterium]|nr:hypothetical protein [Planctomycetaceae bacterium]
MAIAALGCLATFFPTVLLKQTGKVATAMKFQRMEKKGIILNQAILFGVNGANCAGIYSHIVLMKKYHVIVCGIRANKMNAMTKPPLTPLVSSDDSSIMSDNNPNNEKIKKHK